VSCGAALPSEVERRDAERKPVTVLFCDLVGFTARSDRADPEDVKATLRPFHTRIVREIETFGGTLDKFIGDGVLGVFGAPASHEDDPERAVRTAFRIQEAIEELNEEHPGLGLAVRIGIDTGEAVVAIGPGPQFGERVTGEVIALAGRLQAVAPVGGIAIGEVTHRATREFFASEELPSIAIPGRSEPLRAWRPIATSRRLARERPKTPFIGREEESALLRAAFRRCTGGPSVQLVTVSGEPGVGKSRLIAEFADHLDREPLIIRWRIGRCRPYGEGVAFAPLVDMVKTEAGILDSDPPGEVRRKLTQALEGLVDEPSEREWLRARLAPLVGLGDPAAADRAESFTAWRRSLEAMAAQHPTVVVFDDLHWADPALLDFIEQVIDWSTGLPLLVVCATRPELFERRPRWGGGKRNATAVSLRPLSETETAMLVTGLVDPATLPAHTKTALLERAGGNPLYAEEFARMLSERASGSEADIPVPETVQAIIGARLDTLPPESKTMLQDAAVLGKVFWAGALLAMDGRTEGEIQARLHDLSKQELVRPIRASTIAGDSEFAFWHLLVRDVAYEQIPRAERGMKHRAAADWIEAVPGERATDRAEVLAYHYGIAADLAGASIDDDLREKAARYHLLAGGRAQRLDAEAADRLLQRALGFLPPGHPSRPPVLVRAAEVASTLGRFIEARRDFDEAAEAYRAAGDARALGDTLARQSRASSRLGDVRRSRRLLDEALELLEGQSPGPELARAYSRRAGIALTDSRWEECRAWAEKALALAERLGLQEEVVRALQFRGASRSELGDEDGLADLWAALRLGTDIGLGEETVLTYGNLGLQLWLRDGPTIALQAYTSALEFSETRGFMLEAMWTKAGQLEALFDLGRWEDVVAIAHEMEAWDREEGGGLIRTYAEVYRGMVLARRGEVDAARLLAEEFLPRVRALNRAEFLAPALIVGALNESARGHRSMATQLIDDFAELTATTPGYRWHHLPEALRLRVAADATEGLERLFPDSQPTCRRYEHSRTSAQALVAEVRGEVERARDLFAAAGAGWRSYGSVLELGHARFGEGRCLLALGLPDAARHRLDEARDRFGTLGAEPLVGAVDDTLRTASV
jgi:class 3 adenylate cyclase/tetratricopeptide (TPR) repeat protein